MNARRKILWSRSQSLSLDCKFKAHPWRHRCIKCKKIKSDHELSKKDVKRFEKALASIQEASMMESNSHHLYAWVPPEIPKHRISHYFSYFPQDMVPEHDSPGLRNHMRQVSSQIPIMDLSLGNGDFLNERKALLNILNDSIKFAIITEWEDDLSSECNMCQGLLQEKELVVDADEIIYHPPCFICWVCREPLAQLIHCVKSGDPVRVYCLRHFSETFKKRCHACDELIFEAKFVEAGGAFYHPHHLLCFGCDEKLDREGGVFEDDEQLYCDGCFEKKHSDECQLCGRMVGLDRTHIVFEGKFWHSDCFKCSVCGEALESFENLGSKLYCQKCFIPTCYECKESLAEEIKFIKYEAKLYHTQCFRCDDCRISFGKEGTFVPNQGLVYCKACYLRNFGTRCSKCQYGITDEQGVLYKENAYHLTCFICSKCNVQLGKNPFKVIGEKTYCLNCFGNTFCKSCHFCKKSIVLNEKNMLYSYENLSWHPSCFTCHGCGESLEKRQFILRGSSLVCKECAERVVAEDKQAVEQAVTPGVDDEKQDE